MAESPAGLQQGIIGDPCMQSHIFNCSLFIMLKPSSLPPAGIGYTSMTQGCSASPRLNVVWGQDLACHPNLGRACGCAISAAWPGLPWPSPCQHPPPPSQWSLVQQHCRCWMAALSWAPPLPLGCGCCCSLSWIRPALAAYHINILHT